MPDTLMGTPINSIELTGDLGGRVVDGVLDLDWTGRASSNNYVSCPPFYDLYMRCDWTVDLN